VNLLLTAYCLLLTASLSHAVWALAVSVACSSVTVTDSDKLSA
jgi:hypothetical protein